MVKEKNKTIKTADFEAELRKLEQDIKDIKYITKNGNFKPFRWVQNKAHIL